VPDHPDSEQLAAFQAGDGDRRQRAEVEAHLAACPACAEAVAAVDRARDQLALLQEPELPAGLHDRLAAAVDAEVAAGGVADGARSRFRRPFSPAAGGRPALRHGRADSDEPGVRPAPVPGRPRSEANGEPPTGRVAAGQRRGRPAPWYRRPVAWGAAAALLLAALVAVPLLDRSDEVTTASGAGGAQAAREADAGATGAVPLVPIPGEVSAATVRSRLDADTQARAALDAAGARTAVRRDQAAPPSAQAPGEAAAPSAPGQAATDGDRSTTLAPQAGAAGLGSCPPAATAVADPATRPLVPAFYVEGTYQGREATILVTTSAGQPGRVDLWVFPRGNCSAPPLASERVR
jgi:anti-sigma factor RsiW